MNTTKVSYLGSFAVFASYVSPVVARQDIATDSSLIAVTPFKEAIKDRYTGNDFNYDINDTGGINLLQQLLSRFFNWLSDIFGIQIDFIDYKILEIIIYGLLAVGALYLLIRFLIENRISKVFKNEETTIDGFSFIEENITEIDFEKLIAQAVESGNYRLATRYLYLKSLKALAKNKVIDWHYDKTNSDYLKEIKNDNTKQLFKRASYVYDYIWYGDFPVDEQLYQKNMNNFIHLQNLKNNG